jgi:hypothetical protein
MDAGGAGQLPDPFVDPDADGVARLLADRLSQRRFDRQPVGAVALGHQRARERLTVDRSPDLHQPAGTEQLGHVVHQHARPRTGVVALLKLGVELSQHDSSDSRTQQESSPVNIADVDADVARSAKLSMHMRCRRHVVLPTVGLAAVERRDLGVRLPNSLRQTELHARDVARREERDCFLLPLGSGITHAFMTMRWPAKRSYD